MAITLPDSRQLSDGTLQAFRLLALHGRELGYSEADLGELLGVCCETVSRWRSAYTRRTRRVTRRTNRTDEYLNNDLRRQIYAEGLSKSSFELRSRTQQFLRKLVHFPDHVRS